MWDDNIKPIHESIRIPIQKPPKKYCMHDVYILLYLVVLLILNGVIYIESAMKIDDLKRKLTDEKAKRVIMQDCNNVTHLIPTTQPTFLPGP